jgi:hypothetical protein
VNLSVIIRKRRSKFVIRLQVSVFTVTSMTAELPQTVYFNLTHTFKCFLFPYVLIILICFATDLLTCKLFNVYINAVCDSDFSCSCVLLAEDLKFFHNIGHVEGCKLLQFHFDAV